MLSVLNCVVFEHEWGLLLVAALICVSSSLMAMWLVRLAQFSCGNASTKWYVLAGTMAGVGAWLTHFTAMLAYTGAGVTHIDATLTVLSFAIAMVGGTIAYLLFNGLKKPFHVFVGGAALGATVSGLHYTGMAAYGASATLVWNTGFVVASIVLASLFSMGAFFALCKGRATGNTLTAGILLVLGICALHFTGMTGLTLVPMEFSTDSYLIDYSELKVAVVAISIALLGSGAIALQYERRTMRSKADEADRLLEMTEQLTLAVDKANRAAQAKSDFLANMSHEIRTPMNGILGMTEVLLDRKLGADEKEIADVIHLSAQRLLTTLNDILDLSKLDAGKIHLNEESFNLRVLIGEVIQLMGARAASNGLALQLDYNDQMPTGFLGDENRLRQVLVNLVGNALKFTDTGGVTVKATGTQSIDGDWNLELAVEDTGVGIHPDHLQKIFEKFEQADNAKSRQHEGTGLGLPISREIVQLMNGDIRVESTVGQGSVFTVALTLPAAELEHAAPVNDTLWCKPQPTDDCRLILAEDNLVNRMVVTKPLETDPHDIILAENGEEAVQAFLTNEVDLILMDVSMPKVDGHEATRRIRQIEAERGMMRTPIIGVTAHAREEDREACFAAGMDDFLPKPVDRDGLQAMVAKWRKIQAEAA